MEEVEIGSVEEALRITRSSVEKYRRLGYTIGEVCRYAEDYVDPLLGLDHLGVFNDCYMCMAAKEYLHKHLGEE